MSLASEIAYSKVLRTTVKARLIFKGRYRFVRWLPDRSVSGGARSA